MKIGGTSTYAFRSEICLHTDYVPLVLRFVYT